MKRIALVAWAFCGSMTLVACSGSVGGENQGSGGSASGNGGAGGTQAAGAGGTTAGAGQSGTGGAPSGAGGASGTTGTGGTATKPDAGGGTGSTGTGGAATGVGGATGTGGAGTGGAAGTDAGGASGTACTVGAWPTADPSVTGPFATMTENNVGPAVGAGVDGGPPVAFTLYRPSNLAQGGLCHPVITWGNGTGTTPNTYRILLTHLASHGFVVIASNSLNVAQQDTAGDPLPMVAGITWVYAQNADPTSAMYQRIDTTHAGATGHSQGGFATTTAAAQDTRIVAIAPIAGAQANARTMLHGPALLLCGGMDTTVPCSTVMNAYNAINNVPIMLADQLAATHGGWVSFRAGMLNPYEVAVTAWMRVHLMNDTALRPMFYGPTCTLCQNTTVWQVMQKMLAQ